MSYEKDGIQQVDVNELKEILQKTTSKQIIIDVREPEEYTAGHIPGVPLLPMHSIPAMVEGFSKDKEYIFVCRSGNRSQNVSLFLKENGIENVINFNGGMLSWDEEVNEGIEQELETIEELKKWKK